jgi:hypothetical protein
MVENKITGMSAVPRRNALPAKRMVDENKSLSECARLIVCYVYGLVDCLSKGFTKAGHRGMWSTCLLYLLSVHKTGLFNSCVLSGCYRQYFLSVLYCLPGVLKLTFYTNMTCCDCGPCHCVRSWVKRQGIIR